MAPMTADELVNRRRREIGALLDMIRERCAAGDMAAASWPVAGTLGHVQEELLDLAVHLANDEREETRHDAHAEMLCRVSAVEQEAVKQATLDEALRRG